MRAWVMAAALAAAMGGPAASNGAMAQESELDRAETQMRDALGPAGAEVERTSPREIRVRMPADITFDFNRANVRTEFMPRVRDLARILNTNPSLSIAIVGHADAIGSDAYNQRLSERRAFSVGNALIDEGVRRRRIDATGMGEMSPIASNATEWGRARNRRVEIRVVGDRRYEDERFPDDKFE
ncbi:MAG: OmpA family protein [Hyphomonadaceae bacterium]